MKLVSILLACAFIVFAIMMTSDFVAFLNGPSALIVLGVAALWTIAQHSAGAIRSALGAALASESPPTEDIPRHSAVLSTLRTSVLGAGLVGTLIGLVKMLADMSDPSTIGPAMAVAVLTTLYGVLIAEIILAPLIGGLTRPQLVDGEGESVWWPFVGLTGVLGMILAGILWGGRLGIFVDVPSICIVVGVALCLVSGQYSTDELINTIGGALRRRPLTAEAAKTHQASLSTIRGIFHAGGAVGFLVGVVIMFNHLDDPTRIGPAMAISLLTPFYASLSAELFIGPLVAGLPARVTDPENLELDHAQTSWAPMAYYFLGALAVFLVLLFSFNLGGK